MANYSTAFKEACQHDNNGQPFGVEDIAFVQYSCELSDEELEARNLSMLGCVSLGTFGMLVFLIKMARYRAKEQILGYEFEQYFADMSEYVVEIRI